MKENEFYDLPKAGPIKRFLWMCAGGDRFLLERATYSDQIKYLCLGGIVLSTGIMAGLAGGYAFYTIFAPKTSTAIDYVNIDGNAPIGTDIPTAISAVIFAIVWGLVIFNIDRFIVTSTGKGDGTEKITKQEFFSALPRIIMGAIIAITISKPVEIRMFKSEIDAELHNAQMEKQSEYREKVDSEFKDDIERINLQIAEFEEDIQDKINRHKELEKQYIEEARIVTVGPRARAIKAQMDAVAREIDTDKESDRYQNLINKREAIFDEKDQRLEKSQQVASGLDGLLERIQLAHEIAGWPIILFVTLLFLAIELTPVFFKLMLIKSPYDYLSENRDDLIKANNGIEVKYNYYQDKNGLERHLVVNHDAEDKLFEQKMLSDIQRDLKMYALEKYKDEEMKNIDNNLQEYIQKM